MADIQSAVNAIMSDPAAMEQIRSLGSMLGIGENTPPAAEKPSGDIASLLSSLSGGSTKPEPPPAANADTMSAIMKFAPLIGRMNEENDSTRLINALKPFLSEKRRQRADQAVKLLAVLKLLPMLKELF